MSLPKVHVVKELTGCARCGNTHLDVEFKRVSDKNRLLAGEFTHYGECPINHEPILMKFVEETKEVKF